VSGGYSSLRTVEGGDHPQVCRQFGAKNFPYFWRAPQGPDYPIAENSRANLAEFFARIVPLVVVQVSPTAGSSLNGAIVSSVARALDPHLEIPNDAHSPFCSKKESRRGEGWHGRGGPAIRKCVLPPNWR